MKLKSIKKYEKSTKQKLRNQQNKKQKKFETKRVRIEIYKNGINTFKL